MHVATTLFRDWMRPYQQNLKEFKNATNIRIQGELPRSICGTYLRNGPGIFYQGTAGSQDGKKHFMPMTAVAHPFDGDGAVVSVKFDGSAEAQFRVRFVETAEYVTSCPCVHFDGKGNFESPK